jgi:hypothetical protein
VYNVLDYILVMKVGIYIFFHIYDRVINDCAHPFNLIRITNCYNTCW